MSVQVSRIGGFDGPVGLTLANPPDGFSAESSTAAGPNGVLHIDVGPRVRAGTYELTIVGRGLDVEHHVQIEVVVTRHG